MRHMRKSAESDEALDCLGERDRKTIRTVSKVLEVVFFSIAALLLAGLCVLIAFSITNGDASHLALGSIAQSVLPAVGLGITAAMLLVAGAIFRDMSKGETPFTAKQARRIQVIAWLLLAYALVDSILPSGVTMAVNVDDTVLGVNRNATDFPSIRLGTILVSLVFFFLSYVFKYGVKLQQLSDDVL